MLPRVSQVKCKDADYLLFSTTDVISNQLFRTGEWEPHLLKISEIFYAGLDAPLVLDIGANLGAYSIPIAKKIHDIGGTVIGFEPQRIVYYQLCANVFLNRLDNYYALNQAVGDFNGVVEMPEINYEVSQNVGAFSFEKQYRELHGIENSILETMTKVPIITLDNFEVEKAPVLIKIDVEGFELNVLKGGAGFLEHHKYPPILFEAWSFDWFKEGRGALLGFLEKLGYKITSFNTSDYVAQHPSNSVSVTFTMQENGSIAVNRLK